MSCFCIIFWSNLTPYWQPWTPKILQKWEVTLDTMDCNPDKIGTSYRISLQDRFLVDFGASKTSPRRLQGGSRRLKTAPKWCQDASKTAQDASQDAVHFWQETFLSLQRTMNRWASTKCSSQLTTDSFIFTIHNLQVRGSSSAFAVYSWWFTCSTALPCTLHQEQDSHAQTKSTMFELRSLNSCFSASRLSGQIKIYSTTKRADSGASSLYRLSLAT